LKNPKNKYYKYIKFLNDNIPLYGENALSLDVNTLMYRHVNRAHYYWNYSKSSYTDELLSIIEAERQIKLNENRIKKLIHSNEINTNFLKQKKDNILNSKTNSTKRNKTFKLICNRFKFKS